MLIIISVHCFIFPIKNQRKGDAGGAAIAIAVARVSRVSFLKIRFLIFFVVLCQLFGSSAFVNVSRSSIKSPDRAVVEYGLKISLFFICEVSVSHQLIGRSRQNVNNGAKSKDKSISVPVSQCLKLFRVICEALNRISLIMFSYSCLSLIHLLLMMGGVELNPGPALHDVNEHRVDFHLLSQNCRGLTDRKKIIKLLKQVYPTTKKVCRSPIVSCFQETHVIDRFAIDNFFKGQAVIDDGERNQRGVCILVPEEFEVCESLTSGIGRWVIVVIKPKLTASTHRFVFAALYAPNCHREARAFYQEFFHNLDDITDGIAALNDSYETIICGDFNAVLDPRAGAQNRTRSVAESELSELITDAMDYRELTEPAELTVGNCYTWRRGNCLSKLDYVFLSRSIANKIVKAEILWYEYGALFDHAALRVQFKGRLDTVRGKSFPKIFKTDIASEVDRAWLNDQLLQSESQILPHWSPHLRLDFIKTMLRSKALELRQMRKFTDGTASIQEKIANILASIPISDCQLREVEALRLRLHEASEKEAETLRLKAGIKWREEGEKSTAYFLSRFKANIAGATMQSIRIMDRVVEGSRNILAVVQQFYQNLYSKPPPAKLADADFCEEFFAHCPTIGADHQRLLARPLDLFELKEALKTCSDSAPGLDGIPYSFYAAFPDLLLKYVLDSWSHALRTGTVADSHKRSCISLLPKKGKDLMQLGNWRPISLSDCDLKLITKAYANRLKAVLPDILCEAQAAYVPGRDISFNNRILQYAKSYAIASSKDYCIVSLDAQKAFDSVSHEYLVKVLEAYGFPPEFVLVFQTLYAHLESVVQVNGFLSPAFRIKNGVKQGDALSCGLFVLAIDPLLRNLMGNRHIQFLDIPTCPNASVEVGILSYADDVTIVCENSCLQPIFDEYERLSLISGLVLNADKTEVFNFIRSPNRVSNVRYLDQDYQLGRVERIRICGIWLAIDTALEYSLNIHDKIRAMESIVMSWGRRTLSMNGKMILAKTFLLSLIVFPAQVLTVHKKECKKIERLIYSFVNGARTLYGPERIARASLKAPKSCGGINGVDVDSFLRALAVKQYGKAASRHRILSQLQSSYENLSCGISPTAKLTLRAHYKEFAADYALPELHQLPFLSSIPLNLLLAPGSVAARLAGRMDVDSLGGLQTVFRNDRHRAGVNKILRSIPRQFALLVRSGSLTQSPSSVIWFMANSICRLEKISTKQIKLYLVNHRFPRLGPDLKKTYKRADWPPPNCEFESTFKGIWEIKHPTLRAIRLKILYKDVFSNERRHRFGLTNSAACAICGQTESVEHHLLSCVNATRIWSLFHRLTDFTVVNLFDVVRCDLSMEAEIVKSVLIKALLQIDRSAGVNDIALIKECVLYLRIEAKSDSLRAGSLLRFAERIANL